MGSNRGTIYWMDFFALICCKNYIVCVKRLKLNEKEAEDGPFLKIVYLKYDCKCFRHFNRLGFYGEHLISSLNKDWLKNDKCTTTLIVSTHFLPLSLYHSFYICLSLSLSISLSLSLFHSFYISLSFSLIHCLSFNIYLSLTLSLSHSFSFSLSFIYSLSHSCI